MASKIRHSFLVFWHYLNQPLFSSSSVTTFKPRRFWYLYQVQLLERCLYKDCESKSHPRLWVVGGTKGNHATKVAAELGIGNNKTSRGDKHPETLLTVEGFGQ